MICSKKSRFRSFFCERTALLLNVLKHQISSHKGVFNHTIFTAGTKIQILVPRTTSLRTHWQSHSLNNFQLIPLIYVKNTQDATHHQYCYIFSKGSKPKHLFATIASWLRGVDPNSCPHPIGLFTHGIFPALLGPQLMRSVTNRMACSHHIQSGQME